MTMGYIGPSRRPKIDTATAFWMRDGTNQTVNSNLRGFFVSRYLFHSSVHVPNGQEGIEEDDTPFSDKLFDPEKDYPSEHQPTKEA